MKIAVQSGGMEERLGIDGTYRMIKETGFDAVDANLDHLFRGHEIRAHLRSPLIDGPEEQLLETCRPWKESAEKYGLENYQAHAPFPSALPPDPEYPDYNDYLIHCLEVTIKCTAYIGCHRLIVHPFFYGMPAKLSPEAEWEQNIRSYSALIDAAKKYDVIICLENMFNNYKGKIYGACCSDIETACKYIDTLNGIAGEKRFGFCLDTGHILLAGKDIYDTMVQLGDRIEAFHVHDNNGTRDQHLAPYMGILDWDRFVAGLAAINYDKTLSFETFNVWNTVDQELCPDMMRYIAKSGRMFARRAEEVKAAHA
jgi:sugar phosphate isomerase/epimerase